MLKYIVAIVAILSGLVLALSPMLFAEATVHPDRIFHAQWAGFIFMAAGIGLGFQAIGCSHKGEAK